MDRRHLRPSPNVLRGNPNIGRERHRRDAFALEEHYFCRASSPGGHLVGSARAIGAIVVPLRGHPSSRIHRFLGAIPRLVRSEGIHPHLRRARFFDSGKSGRSRGPRLQRRVHHSAVPKESRIAKRPAYIQRGGHGSHRFAGHEGRGRRSAFAVVVGGGGGGRVRVRCLGIRPFETPDGGRYSCGVPEARHAARPSANQRRFFE
mmetsp:Transcript_31641/g.94656  ORF Transcript_31641/g.94656 Transcript_31641/m.94656 type:complete len:204 (-) Transcript_31641:1108-1719(-)